MASSSSGPSGSKSTNFFEGKPTQRTVPEWVDPNSGQLQILLLRATGKNVLPVNPFLVSKTVQAVTGPFRNVKTQRDSENRIQYVLMIRDQNQVNKLLQIKSLIDGTPVKILHHPTLNQRRCVVTCRDVIDLDEKDLLAELGDQNVIGVRRITRWDTTKKTKVPTPTLILTIRGTVIPEAIFFGFIRVATKNYYPNPMQCYACYKYGHTSKTCKQAVQLCRNCGKNHHDENDKEKLCDAPAYCINCAGKHASTSRTCPEWRNEFQISKIRIDMGISYKEAKDKHESINNAPSYASKLQERLKVIREGGCNQCKCNCTTSTPERSNSSTDNTSDMETDSSSSESEDSDIPMETATTAKNNKRKINKKLSTSGDQKTSEDDEKKNTPKTRKKPRNENPSTSQTQTQNSYATTDLQQQPSSSKSEQQHKKKPINTKTSKCSAN